MTALMMHLDKEVLEKTMRATPEGLAMAVEMPTSLPLQALTYKWPDDDAKPLK